MSPLEIGLLGLVALFALIALGVPIGFSMGLVGVVGLWLVVSPSAAYAKLAIVPFQKVSDYDLAVLPLFLLMAYIFTNTGIGKDLFNLAYRWLGRFPGGLGLATVSACGIFAAISSSSIATAATMGSVALPEMKRFKYDPRLATGLVAAGGTVGSLIPPSGVLIIYGILTQTSIGKLFLGGWIPGIMEVVAYMIVIYLLCRFNPLLGPRGESFSFKEKFFAFLNAGEAIGLILFVLLGLMVGWFTPTEAGAVGAVGALAFSLIRKRLTWVALKKACISTLRTTGMIYGILIGAFIFNYFLATTRLPMALSEFVSQLALPPLALLGVIMLVYFVLGCFLDAAAMHVLTIPIFFPLAVSLGFDAIWFGVVVTRAMEVAMITPPIGMNVFVIAGVAPDVPMGTIFRGIVPFLIADIICIILLLLLPQLVLFLPSLAV